METSSNIKSRPNFVVLNSRAFETLKFKHSSNIYMDTDSSTINSKASGHPQVVDPSPLLNTPLMVVVVHLSQCLRQGVTSSL
eukprot:gene2501-3255_t